MGSGITSVTNMLVDFNYIQSYQNQIDFNILQTFVNLSILNISKLILGTDMLQRQ